MDSDNKAVLLGMMIAATVILGVVVCVTYYQVSENLTIQRMVEKGSDPIRAKCAINPSQSCQLVYSQPPKDH